MSLMFLGLKLFALELIKFSISKELLGKVMDTKYNFQPNSYKSNSESIPGKISNNQQEEQSLDLSWIVGVLRRRCLIIIVFAVTLIGLSGTAIISKSRKIKPEYKGTFRLLIEPVTAEDRLANLFLHAQESNPSISKASIEGSWVDYQSLIRVLKSPQLIDPLLKKIKPKYPDMTYNSLMGNLDIIRVSYEASAGKIEGTKIIEVNYTSSDPKKIEFVLKSVAESYIAYGFQDRMESLNKGQSFLKSQIPRLAKRVDILQDKIQKFRQTYDLFDPQVQGEQFSIQSRTFKDQLLEIQTKLAENRKLYEIFKAKLSAGDLDEILLYNLDGSASLLRSLQELESKIALESVRLRADSIPILYLQEQRKSMLNLVQKKAENIVNGIDNQINLLQAREKTIIEAQKKLNDRIRQLPYIARESADLQLQLEVTTRSLKDSLSKREALELDVAQQRQPWHLITPPNLLRDQKGEAISLTVNNSSKQLMLSFIMSILLSLAIGFLVEVMNTVFHGAEEIKIATKIPIIGVIPFAKTLDVLDSKSNSLGASSGLGSRLGSERLLSQSKLDFPFLEAFRSLYTNIYLLSADRPIRSLVIGSATDGDGKSTVSIYLAKTAAAVGQRVLLVDADLRIPQLHQQLGIPNVKGLSDALTTDLSLNDAIQRSPVDDNLFVLTAGHTPPDPIKLLSSKKMRYLMEQFQAFFDLVIYDIPPLVGLADGHLVAANTDGTVLVVRLERTDRAIVKKALDELSLSGASVLGIAANGAKESQLSSTRNQSIPMPTTTSVRSL